MGAGASTGGSALTNTMWLRWVGVLLALGLIAAACGGSRDDDNNATESTTTTPKAAGGAEKFGTLAAPCGPGDAKGATEQGVTDDHIVIGFGDDRGFASSPGLLHQMGDSINAFIQWCNDQGGILGRKLQPDFK